MAAQHVRCKHSFIYYTRVTNCLFVPDDSIWRRSGHLTDALTDGPVYPVN
jgi:hypothetical protein